MNGVFFDDYLSDNFSVIGKRMIIVFKNFRYLIYIYDEKNWFQDTILGDIT